MKISLTGYVISCIEPTIQHYTISLQNPTLCLMLF